MDGITTDDTIEAYLDENTRFYLIFQARYAKLRKHNDVSGGWDRWEFTIKVEVSEEAYRKAYNEAWELADDMTHPLDEWWYQTVTAREAGAPYHPNITHYRGGRISW